jgi:hypothetical protein
MAHLDSPTAPELHRTLWSRPADGGELPFPANCSIQQQAIGNGSVEGLPSSHEEAWEPLDGSHHIIQVCSAHY